MKEIQQDINIRRDNFVNGLDGQYCEMHIFFKLIYKFKNSQSLILLRCRKSDSIINLERQMKQNMQHNFGKKEQN